jgi:hypothetical protein
MATENKFDVLQDDNVEVRPKDLIRHGFLTMTKINNINLDKSQVPCPYVSHYLNGKKKKENERCKNSDCEYKHDEQYKPLACTNLLNCTDNKCNKAHKMKKCRDNTNCKKYDCNYGHDEEQDNCPDGPLCVLYSAKGMYGKCKHKLHPLLMKRVCNKGLQCNTDFECK